MSGPVDVLVVIRDSVRVFETPSFRQLLDMSEFAVDAGTLHTHLMASYTAVAELIAAASAGDEEDHFTSGERPPLIGLTFDPVKAARLRAALAGAQP